jgi:hypothetical protein
MKTKKAPTKSKMPNLNTKLGKKVLRMPKGKKKGIK